VRSSSDGGAACATGAVWLVMMMQRISFRAAEGPYTAHMSRHLLAIASVCAALLVGATCALASRGSENNPAPIAHRVGYDLRRAVSFDLNGRTLTVSVSPKALVRKRLLGQSLSFVCGRRSKKSQITTNALATWPAGSNSVTVALPDDISAVANFCLVRAKAGGPVITQAGFSK